MLEKNSDWQLPPQPVPESDINHRYEADVIVIGTGHAGVSCARACAEGGLSVIALEAMTQEKYWAYGIDFGHINSRFLLEQGVPRVDELELFNDWQLRNGNRSNPRLVMKFIRNCGDCFDWFMEALSPWQRENVKVRFWPPAKEYAGQLNGIKTWVGTATFPEELWENKAITNAVWANIDRAREEGAQFHFGITAEQIEKINGRAVAVLAKDGEGNYLRYTAKKAIVLAAGDFSGNEQMVRDLCDELYTLAYDEDERVGGFGRNGSGIRMGLWAGGRMVPGPIATMGGNTAAPMTPLDTTATLWLDGDCQRFCNEGFGDGAFSGLEAARLKRGVILNLFDGKVMQLLQRQAPVHGAVWLSDPSDPKTARCLQYLENARAAGADGYAPPSAHGGGVKLYAADTLEELAEYLGLDQVRREAMLASINRYNALCMAGRDEDFGKDPSLMMALDTPPYYGASTDLRKQKPMGPMVTVDGLWTDDNQNVYDRDLNVISGLYATGNCCGRRFGVQYSTPVSGVSIGIAWTLGRELGKHLSVI